MKLLSRSASAPEVDPLETPMVSSDLSASPSRRRSSGHGRRRSFLFGGGRASKAESSKDMRESSDDSSALAMTHSADSAEEKQHAEVVFKRNHSSFLRVADLDMDETLSLRSSSEDSADSYPNFHHISVDPPPGVETDPKERWVVLDDGDGKHAPIAPLAVSALARSGFSSTFDMEMWTADGRTGKVLKQTPAWNDVVWQKDGPVSLPKDGSLNEKEIMVWSGSFKHGHYGSELPAIRSCGIIDMNAKKLIELLVDSHRVKEYNKLSLGRSDLLMLQEDMGTNGAFGGVTKVMKTETKPPMVRKTLQFTSLMHARALGDGSGYKMVTRAVTLPEDEKEDLANALKSEILLGATVIKRIEGNDDRCLLVSVNHLRSPMVPMMIAKRIGLQAAHGFIQDLRACCKN